MLVKLLAAVAGDHQGERVARYWPGDRPVAAARSCLPAESELSYILPLPPSGHTRVAFLVSQTRSGVRGTAPSNGWRLPAA